jgi:hypothetical protein
MFGLGLVIRTPQSSMKNAQTGRPSSDAPTAANERKRRRRLLARSSWGALIEDHEQLIALAGQHGDFQAFGVCREGAIDEAGLASLAR